MNVLLVDDDPEIRLLAGYLLRAAGHHVAEADDATSARAAFAAQVPDVVLMDLMLGCDDGVEAATALFQSAPAGPRLIFLTAATQPDELKRMNDAGAAGILHKPFDPDSFVERFDAILAGAA